MNPLGNRRSFLVASACAALMPSAWGAEYPTRPVTLVVSYPAGAAVDRAARAFAQQLERRLGQSVIVENAAGASGTIGAKKVLRSPADGYTLLMGTNNEVVISPGVLKAGYSARDFTPVSMLGFDTTVVVANPAFPPNSIDELVAYARASSAPTFLGVVGSATMQTFGGALLAEAGGFKFANVVYKGGAPLITDLVGGQVQVASIALTSVLPLIRQGKLKAIGVLSGKRRPTAPEIPTVNEGRFVKGVEADLWIGLFAPGKLPAPILARLSGAMRATLKDEGYRESEMRAGSVLLDSFLEPPAFGQFIRREHDRLQPLIANVKLD